MKRIVIVTTALLATQIMDVQAAPMHGGGPLVMEVADARDAGGDVHTAPADGSDDDGSMAGDHTLRGDGKPAHAAHDGDGANSDPAARTTPNTDSAQPAATPRHPGYRWQSLIPGAIK